MVRMPPAPKLPGSARHYAELKTARLAQCSGSALCALACVHDDCRLFPQALRFLRQISAHSFNSYAEYLVWVDVCAYA
jgi:hypothetical protein